MSDAEIIICPKCGAANRVPVVRLGAGPICGKCKERLFSATPVEVTEAEFDRHVGKGSVPILADFWASWCGPCRMMAPAFHAATAELEPKVRLVKVNTEQEQSLANRYAIRSIPTLILFSQGVEIARISGALDRNSLINWVRQNVRGV